MVHSMPEQDVRGMSLRACMTSSPFTLFPSDLWKTHNILLFCNLAGTQESIVTVFHPTSLSSMMHEIMVSKSVCVHPFGKIKETHRRGWLRPTMNGCPCMHSCQWWCCKWQPCYICSDKHNLPAKMLWNATQSKKTFYQYHVVFPKNSMPVILIFYGSRRIPYFESTAESFSRKPRQFSNIASE